MKKASHPAEQKRVELIWCLVDEPGCSLQPAPARGLAAVEVLEVYPRLLEEPAKVGLGSELPEVPCQLSPREPKRATHIAEDRLLRNAVEPDVAARREVGEVVLDLALEPSTRRTGEGAEPPIETELGSLVADEVQDGKTGLAVSEPEAATELLEEERRAFGRAKEEDRVDLRDVDAFVEQIHSEYGVDPSIAKRDQGVATLLGRRLRRDRDSRDAGSAKPIRHEAGMVDAHAEAESPHRTDVGDGPSHSFDDLRGPPVVARVERGELLDVVAAALPCDTGQVDVVRNTEVLEWTQQAPFERLPQTKLDGNPTAEPAGDVTAVSTLGGRRQPEENLRFHMLEEALVRCRFRVVEFVDDHHRVVIGRQVAEVEVREGLDRGEDVPPLVRSSAVYVRLPEAPVAHHLPECAEALVEDFLAVRDKEEPVDPTRRAKSAVVERGHDRLPGPGCHDDQVPPSVMNVALGIELLEDFDLIRVRPDLERADLQGCRPLAPGRGDLRVETRPVLKRVRLERRVVPIVVESCRERVDEVRLLNG